MTAQLELRNTGITADSPTVTGRRSVRIAILAAIVAAVAGGLIATQGDSGMTSSDVPPVGASAVPAVASVVAPEGYWNAYLNEWVELGAAETTAPTGYWNAYLNEWVQPRRRRDHRTHRLLERLPQRMGPTRRHRDHRTHRLLERLPQRMGPPRRVTERVRHVRPRRTPHRCSQPGERTGRSPSARPDPVLGRAGLVVECFQRLVEWAAAPALPSNRCRIGHRHRAMTSPYYRLVRVSSQRIP